MKRRDMTPFDGYAERLRMSPNPFERDSFLLGMQLYDGWPVLLYRELLFDHIHILGGTGTGKTSVALTTLARQMIRRGDAPVVIVDCKGDPAFFNTLWHDATLAGRTFKWFTTKPNRSTYIFNPFELAVFRRMSVSEIVGFIIQSLNLHHGTEYGRSWFAVASRILARRSVEGTLPLDRQRSQALQATRGELPMQFPPLRSFRDLHEAVSRIARDDKELKAGMHLCYVVESLADFDQINLVPNRSHPESALDHAIHMPDVIRDKQVVYFYLVGAVDLASVAELARLVLYSLLTAAIAHKDTYGVHPEIYFVCDEAQALIAQNIQVVLTQARSHGLACTLAHQYMSQLNPPSGADLRELFMGCTATKYIQSARDPWLQKYISDMSGRAKYFTQAYDQYAEHVLAGFVGPENAAPGRDGVCRISIQEYYDAKLTVDDIREYSYQDNVSIVGIEHGKGLSQFYGWTPIYTEWPMTLREYQFLNNHLPWPVHSTATIQTESDWPTDDGNTIETTAHQPIPYDDLVAKVNQALLDMKEKSEEP